MKETTVSLEAMYNQVQAMLEDAGIPTATLFVEGEIKSYQHIKEGRYQPANMEPKKEISICVSLNETVIVFCTHHVPSVVLEDIRVKLMAWKVEKNPSEKIVNIEL